jgi:hypothetical protein
MQIRCTYCQTMFAINHEEMLSALEQMEEEKLKFYDAHCPKCRRANRIERLKLEFSYPNWRDDLKTMAKVAQVLPAVPVAAVTAPVAETAASPKKKHSHKPAGAEKTTPKVIKPVAKKKPAPAKKVAPAGVKKVVKKTAGKPVAKKVKKPVKKPASGSKKK